MYEKTRLPVFDCQSLLIFHWLLLSAEQEKKCHLSLIRTCIFNTLVSVSLGFCLCPVWEDQPFSIKDLCWVLISIANIFLQFRKPIPRWEIHFSATVPVLHVSRMSLQALIKHIIKIDSQNLWIFFSNSLPNCVFIIIMKIGEVSFLNSVLHMVTDFYWGKNSFLFSFIFTYMYTIQSFIFHLMLFS